jgi:heavy metal sensor kinase
MIHSVRARLAAWYAGSFAVLILVFATAAYAFLAHTTRERIDEHLAETANAVAAALAHERTRTSDDSTAAATVVGEFAFRDVGVAVYDGESGALIVANDAYPAIAGTRQTAWSVAPELMEGTQPRIRTLRVEGDDASGYAMPVRIEGRAIIIETTQSLRTHTGALAEARIALLIGIPLGLLLATVGGYALGRKSLQPVATMGEAAARIGATTLGERLPVLNPRDELGRLATAFNDLLGRLDTSFEQQRRFMADASHELRTPVSIIKGEAELALARADRPMEELREALATVRGESRRLTRIVDDLFLLARANAGEQPLIPAELYLEEVAAESVHAARTLAAAAGVTLRYAPERELPFRGDEGLLRRMLDNLLGNAIKFSPRGATVDVSAARANGSYLIAVSDQGAGVPAGDQARIFERFYRAAGQAESAARGDGTGGAGLGLPIARWIAEAHGGQLELARSDASGSTFVASLPAPPNQQDGA